MNQKMIHASIAITACLVSGCERLPEGPITPDGYRPPAPTQENVEKMAREAIRNMVFIEGGTYDMGNVVCFTDKQDELVEKYQIINIFCETEQFPVHRVTLDSFYLNKYEISYYQYDLFTQTVKRSFIKQDFLDPQWWKTRGETLEAVIEKFTDFRSNKTPAAVDWFQSRDYCRWLGAITGLPIDLPTEAQWEYAARNRGQDIPYATDNGKQELGRNYPAENDHNLKTIDSHPPNPLGLHHMSGNVSEWVLDWYSEDYYTRSEKMNPKGPAMGTRKVKRGGDIDNSPSANHTFQRSSRNIDYTHDQEAIKKYDFIKEGNASSSHGARCAIHLAEPIDIDNLKIDLTRPAPDSRAEWLATKDDQATTTK